MTTNLPALRPDHSAADAPLRGPVQAPPASAPRSQPNSPPQCPPQPQQFSRERQADFLDALSEWGNVAAAARVAGVSRMTAYRMRRACPRFEQLWKAALLRSRSSVEAVLADRALNGVEEQVFYHGEEVAMRRRYDARLLLAHLGRLDRIEADPEARTLAHGFDEALDALAELPELTIVAVARKDAGGDGGRDAGVDAGAGEGGDRSCGDGAEPPRF